MDAVAYIRVSTNKEEQELSLENQREFFEKYVGNRNDTLIRIYSDKGKSATKMKNRKDLQRLLSGQDVVNFSVYMSRTLAVCSETLLTL